MNALYTQPHIYAIGLNTKALQEWLTANAVPVVAVLIGLTVLVAVRKGEVSTVMTMAFLVPVGLALVAIGTVPGAPGEVGSWVLSLIGIGGGR